MVPVKINNMTTNILDTLLAEYEKAELALLAIIKNQTLDGMREEPDNYEATQEQRKLERDIRKYKRILVIDENNQRANNKIKEKRQELIQLIEDNNLIRKRNRESIIQAR